jgi:hypothetical protein
VEEQFKFVSKMGRSQMENEIESRVKGVTRRLAKILEENSGIETQLENKEIEDYIKIVLNEKERMSKRNNHFSGK